MEPLAIPRTYQEKGVLIADDEPEHLEWLVDFLESLGFKVTIATDVETAMGACQRSWYRIYVIDLNIPLGGWPEPTKSIFSNYPGFTIIQGIRSQGNDGRRVIAYSAHTNDQINTEMGRLYTDFVAKGRPLQLKERIRELLGQPDMTTAALARKARTEAALSKRKQTLVAKPKTTRQSAKKMHAAKKTAATKFRPSAPKTKKSAKPPKGNQ